MTNNYTMKKILYLTLFALASCAAPKNVIYFENAERAAPQTVTQSYNSKIQKDDLLSIIVSSKNPELATPFNKVVSTTTTTPEGGAYLVNSSGDIVFPILGKLFVTGLTNTELASMIENKIIEGGYINDPTVTVQSMNFKISILGEVKLPGVKRIDSERITILDAIGLAGDLTIYGQRENVSVIREENGKREIVDIDLSKKDVFTSPYYYLHPNDIVYVKPNRKQQKVSNSNPYVASTIISTTSLLISIANLIIRF